MLLKYRGNENYLSSLMIVRTFLQGIKLFEIFSFVKGPSEVQIRTIVLFIRCSLVFTTFIMQPETAVFDVAHCCAIFERVNG